MPTDRRCDGVAKGQPVLERPVREAEELDLGDADRCTRGTLLGLAQWRTLLRGEAVDSGFSAGEQRVGDLLALSGEAGDGGTTAVLHVVGVGDDDQCALPVLVEGLEHQGLLHERDATDT